MRAIIDCDPVVHIVANVQWAVGNEENEEMVREHTHTFVKEVLAKCECDEFIMVVQGVGHKNYRNVILPRYKEHRKTQPAVTKWKPIIIDELVKMGAVELKHIESDDALAILAKKYDYEVLVVENDKDLAQIQGRHFNPYKKESPSKPVERWYTYNKFDAMYSLCLQTITGDSTDMPNELCGMEGVGPAKAKALLDRVSQENWLPIISGAYMAQYGISKGLSRMALTFDMVKLLTVPTKEMPETQMVYDLPFIANDLDIDTFESAESENADNLFE